MEGGKTAHSLFKTPLGLFNDSVCRIPVDSDLAKMIHQTDFIILDEEVMAHKHIFLAIDRIFRDILSQKDKNLKNIQFGGIKMLFGGDFRQTIPVTKRTNRLAIVLLLLLHYIMLYYCYIILFSTVLTKPHFRNM